MVSPTQAQRALVIYENFVGIDRGNRTNAASKAKISELKEKHKAELNNAMILPAPLLDEAHEIELLDLSKGKFDFKNCDRCFPVATPILNEREGRKSRQKASLQIVQLGAYKVSIAKKLSDLELVDPDVFHLPEDIGNLLKAHYSQDFGFVVCIFDPEAGVEAHPIGYVCDQTRDGRIFVPCRHEHGHGDEAVMFDHKIYSVNTLLDETADSRENPGESVDEAKRRVSALNPSQWRITNPDYTVAQLFSQAPRVIELVGAFSSFRRREMVGRFANDDLYFTPEKVGKK